MQPFAPETDPRGFRTALGSFATGVTLMTTKTASGPVGMTANSFASVSLDPPLILWSPAKSSGRFAAFTETTHFAVHVLGQGQKELAAEFTRRKDAFDGPDWVISAQGVPLLADCLARFECTIAARHDAGDHVIVVGLVHAVAYAAGAPLLFHAGNFSA